MEITFRANARFCNNDHFWIIYYCIIVHIIACVFYYYTPQIACSPRNYFRFRYFFMTMYITFCLPSIFTIYSKNQIPSWCNKYLRDVCIWYETGDTLQSSIDKWEITRDIICNYKPFYLVVLDTCIEQFNLVFSWGQLSQNAFVITELQCTSYMSHELTSL